MSKKRTIGFIMEIFPATSETWILQQVSDLLDEGYDIQIFSFRKGPEDKADEKYRTYKMSERVKYLDMPKGAFAVLAGALMNALNILIKDPRVLARIVTMDVTGGVKERIKLLYRTAPLVGFEPDLWHCHFGKVANRFLQIRTALNTRKPLITTFYGFDVSNVFREKPADYYDELRKVCKGYIVMTNDMKERVVAHGFPEEKIEVIPVSITIEDYPFSERTYEEGRPVRLLQVGRFVEKKGFEDTLRAFAIAKKESKRPLTLDLVGGGPLEQSLKELAKELNIENDVTFLGYVKINDLIKRLSLYDILVQPSKVAANGDME